MKKKKKKKRKKILESIQTLSDLPRVAQIAAQDRAALEASLLELAAAEEERRVLMERLEALERARPSLEEAAAALEAGRLDASEPLQLALAERALSIVRLRGEATRCEELLEADDKERRREKKEESEGRELVRLTGEVARVVALMERAVEAGAESEERVEQCRVRVVERVREACSAGLTRLGWGSEQFVRPLSWQEVAVPLEWLLVLERGNERAALEPFLAPLRKRFVFHFVESAATARVELFGQCCRWTLGVLALRSDFLMAKVQHGAMRELVREMSVLLSLRAKRDIVALLKETPVPAAKEKLFLDLVDELFSFSEIVDKHYGYSMLEETLDHALLMTLFPNNKGDNHTLTSVALHWLALERGSFVANVNELTILPELLVRAKKRMSVLPMKWQRREYFVRVHAPILTALVQRDDLEEVHALARTFFDWSTRVEFDQDDGLLGKLSDECIARVNAEIEDRAAEIAQDFMEGLSPWFSKNWLYVSEAATSILLADNKARLDVSTELLVPFERMRSAMRQMEQKLGPLYSKFALLLAEQLDERLTQALVFGQAPSMSMELAHQMAFDASLVFGLWSNVLPQDPSRLFKQFSECLHVLQLDQNELTAIAAVHLMKDEHQKELLSQRFAIENLSAKTIKACADLRRDF